MTYIDVLRHARELREIWAHLPPGKMADQVDEHLASQFPEVPDAWIRNAVDEVCDEDANS